MSPFRGFTLSRLVVLLAAVLVWRVTFSVVSEYHNYFPPNFESDFLHGRETYFWGPYRWAFYLHLASGPLALLLGTVLISERLRNRFPRWHRRLGRVQGVMVLFLVAPSGLWMAWYAATGAIAGAGLGTLAIATAVCMALGWRAAVQRRYAVHQRWMQRTFALLCSAVVIRIIGGAATVVDFDALWLYPTSCWVSWLLPLAILELARTKVFPNSLNADPAR
jgi:hypothetical protein